MIFSVTSSHLTALLWRSSNLIIQSIALLVVSVVQGGLLREDNVPTATNRRALFRLSYWPKRCMDIWAAALNICNPAGAQPCYGVFLLSASCYTFQSTCSSVGRAGVVRGSNAKTLQRVSKNYLSNCLPLSFGQYRDIPYGTNNLFKKIDKT